MASLGVKSRRRVLSFHGEADSGPRPWRLARGCGLLIAAGLGGCAYQVPITVDVPGMANPELALQESMIHVSKEMAELKRVKPARAPLPAVAPGELDKVVAFEWNGSLDGAAEKLAKEAGYTFGVSRPWNMPAADVALSTGPMRVLDVFEALGRAAGSRASVEVDPQHHHVEVIYHV